ncbi:MAG: hypothetical protein PHW01_03405 [Patescibacteria group bacterium]|nr:hypothetical protein [Patescibacteria group bacterium]
MEEVNVFIPGKIVRLSVEDIEGNQSEERFKVQRRLGTGYAGEVYLLTHQDSKEKVVLKILRSGNFLKRIIALLARLFATSDFAWCEAEVKMAVLHRTLLPLAVKKRIGRDYLIPSWRRSYTRIPEKKAWGIFLEYDDLRSAYHGTLSGVDDLEVKERARTAHILIDYFKGIGALAFAWQFNHFKREPRGKWYVWCTLFCALAVLLLTIFLNLPYDPKVNMLGVLCLFFGLAGASWLSADNLKKSEKHGFFRGPDLELGMPHIGFCLPVGFLVVSALFLMHKFWGLSPSWAIFLALLFSPGYLFLFELPLFWENIKKGYPIPFGQLEIEEFAYAFGGDPELKEDIEQYRSLLYQFESGRLNPINRLFALLVLRRLLPFSGREWRRRTIERWGLKGKNTSGQAQKMWESFAYYFFFLAVSLFGIIPWRFMLDRAFRQRQIVYWKMRRLEKMLQKGQISRRTARELALDRVSLFSFFLSSVLIRKFYRLAFERHYRRLFLRNTFKIFWNREFLKRRAVARFQRYLTNQRRDGRITDQYYYRIKRLQEVTAIHWWLILYFSLLAPKSITWSVRIAAISGFLMARKLLDIMPGLPNWLAEIIRYDIVPHVPGWLAVILLAMGITALYEIVATLIFGAFFLLRLIPRLKMERFLAGRVIVALLNFFLYVIFACLNGIPGFSIVGVPLAVSSTPYRSPFWLLTIIRWQSLFLGFIRLISLGMWDKGGLGEFYFAELGVNSQARIILKLCALPA